MRLPTILSALFFVAGLNTAFAAGPSRTLPEIEVYKSPTCGCCSKWVDHLRDNGFTVKTIDTSALSRVKAYAGIKRPLQSCHTALIGNYVVEGHVPADDIKRLLAEKPDVLGLTVPGMPMGSPGMEGPRQDRYDTLSIRKDGGTQVFARH